MTARVPESIAELRDICQRGSHGPGGQPALFQLIRRVSIYPTWVLLHLPISANGVTLLAIGTGLAAAGLFAAGKLVLGVIVLQVAMVLDFSDGEVSRYRKQQSKQGSYLDRVYHFTVHPSVFAGLAVAAYRAHDSLTVVAVGLVSTLGVPAFTMVTAYANELAIWKHARRLLERVNADLAAEPPRLDAVRELLGASAPSAPRPVESTVVPVWAAPSVGKISGVWDFPYIFLILTAAILAEVWLARPGGGWTSSPIALALAFYAITYPCWMVLYVWHVLATESTQRGYAAFVEDLSTLVTRARTANDR